MGSKPPEEQDEDKYTIKMICEAVLPLSDQKIALAAGWKIRQGAHTPGSHGGNRPWVPGSGTRFVELTARKTPLWGIRIWDEVGWR